MNSSAFAATSPYKISTGDCRIMGLNANKQWVPERGKFPALANVQGEVFRQGRGWILFQHEDRYYIGSDRCVVPNPPSPLAPEEIAPPLLGDAVPTAMPTPVPMPVSTPVASVVGGVSAAPRSWTRDLYFKLALITFREPVLLTSPTGTAYDYVSSTYGFTPGVGWSPVMSSPFQFHANVSLLIGNSSVAASTISSTGAVATPAPVGYEARTITIFGAMLEPSFLWKVAPKTAAVGLSTPLLYRKASWPTPSADYTIGPATKLRMGLFLKAEFHRGQWVASPSLGFFSEKSNAAAQLEVRYHLSEP